MKIRFLENGRRAHPKDPTFPQLQHVSGEVYDLPDEMAFDALSSRNEKGEARCELAEEQTADEGAGAGADSQAEEEARIAAEADAKAKAAENTGAKEPKREDKKGRGAKALE